MKTDVSGSPDTFPEVDRNERLNLTEKCMMKLLKKFINLQILMDF